jgi:hypothetical protein
MGVKKEETKGMLILRHKNTVQTITNIAEQYLENAKFSNILKRQ